MAKMGRPEKLVDWKIFEQLCHIQCTHEEIASWFKIDRSTLYNKVLKEYEEDFPTTYKKFSEGGKCSLRRNQFKQAEKSCAMAIWLGKIYLGQREPDNQSKNMSEIQKVYVVNNEPIDSKIEVLPSQLSNTHLKETK